MISVYKPPAMVYLILGLKASVSLIMIISAVLLKTLH